ncbi:protein ACCELERATED CELL DEATH 6-like isoform X2 [Mangifera indica]|uniref:protein ACCELERATED CELL DEATH 6-like isoform X2 n=1 Tax=Mangifera indica TaxID=29780 RepID=UPI001CF96205|nr:protein ACCELERATED CELL DEATH 6-like isoform X2 [Mangifera indica]
MYSIARDDDEKHCINSELYKALMIVEDEEKVIELCRKIPDHALHILTIHDDTVLHMATYSKKDRLVLRLLDELPDCYLHKMTRQNNAGNTILHDTATSNHALPVADKVLKKAPGLLGIRNNNGEAALFRAARYGKTDIFNFLAGKVSGYDQTSKHPFLQRTDKTNVLHIAILSQHFELALQIAKEYKSLIVEQDVDGMTPLQLLSCKPEAFKRKHEESFLKKLIKWTCSSKRRELKEKEERQYESAMELAKFLIRKDTTWEDSYSIQDQSRPKIHRYGISPTLLAAEKGSGEAAGAGGGDSAETPLFLATKSGCIEIVREILNTYLQAIEHIDDEGRNILHVAIKYRQLEIFELVSKMEGPIRRLVRKIDNTGNTILHMTGIKRTDYVPEKMEGPAFVLQEELLWYERVQEVTISHFMNHQNNMGLTAEGLFATANNELRISSKEWLKHTAEGCSVVAVLIATVAFAAAYTVPGGSNETTGFPVLINRPFFVVFTISDVLSLTFSLAAVVTFLSILTSPFRLEDFKHSLPNKMTLGFTFLFLSVCLMMVAFAATILLMIENKEHWAKIMLYTCSFVPVGIFALSYFPLYIITSITRGCKQLGKKARRLIPRSLEAFLKRICCLSTGSKARTPAGSSIIP